MVIIIAYLPDDRSDRIEKKLSVNNPSASGIQDPDPVGNGQKMMPHPTTAITAIKHESMNHNIFTYLCRPLGSFYFGLGISSSLVIVFRDFVNGNFGVIFLGTHVF
ncbi:hypothetical protein FOCC_FOCC005194 [Frankliniella occidentalis]|nr:hypothetical protein FOCC_FOCC005194 [Frankliniella occidentalis]